jgi:transcription initiation factor IIE alpha subunit
MESRKCRPQKETMDKIEKILQIDPRNSEDISLRMGLSVTTVRNLLGKLRKQRRAYILKYRSSKYNMSAIWAAGDHEDAKVPPNCKWAKQKRVSNLMVDFDYKKPVACYGIWGLA